MQPLRLVWIAVTLSGLLLSAWSSAGNATELEMLTLERALELVRSNNVDLQIEGERLQQASILTKKAWAVLMPVVSGRASVMRNNQEIRLSDIMGGSPAGQQTPPSGGAQLEDSVIQGLYQQDASLNMSWSLLNGRAIPLIKNARSQVKVARQTYEQREKKLIFAATLAFYNAVNADRQVEIQQRALNQAREHLRLAWARVEVGSATQIDALRSEVEVATAEQAVIQSQNAARLTYQALGVLIGRTSADGQAEPFKAQRTHAVAPTSRHDILQNAYDMRLDLQSSHLQLEMAENSKTETWFKFAPSLSLEGNYRWSSVAGILNQHTTWQLGLALKWNLFEGGLTYWEMQERQHAINMAALAIEKTKQDILKQVTEARLNLDTAEATFQVAKRRAELARQTAELMNAQYEVGAATQLDVLDANRILADGETAEALAELSVDVARVELEFVQVVPPMRANAGFPASAGQNAITAASADTESLQGTQGVQPGTGGAPSGGPM